jgi:hypothetical protein
MMRTRERQLPDIDVLARAFLRRGLSEHPEVGNHVADVADVEKMSTYELMNLAKGMGIDPTEMIRSLEKKDDDLWTYSNRNPGFQGELEFDLTIEAAGKRVTRRAKVVYTHTPEWEYFDERKKAPYTGWESSNFHLEVLAVPPDAGDDRERTILDRPYWTKLEDLQRDEIISREIWDALLDLIDDQCRAEDEERRRIAAQSPPSPARRTRSRN